MRESVKWKPCAKSWQAFIPNILKSLCNNFYTELVDRNLGRWSWKNTSNQKKGG